MNNITPLDSILKKYKFSPEGASKIYNVCQRNRLTLKSNPIGPALKAHDAEERKKLSQVYNHALALNDLFIQYQDLCDRFNSEPLEKELKGILKLIRDEQLAKGYLESRKKIDLRKFNKRPSVKPQLDFITRLMSIYDKEFLHKKQITRKNRHTYVLAKANFINEVISLLKISGMSLASNEQKRDLSMEIHSTSTDWSRLMRIVSKHTTSSVSST